MEVLEANNVLTINQGFTFLLDSLDTDLVVKVIDIEAERMVGQVAYNARRLTEEEDLMMPLQQARLGENLVTIPFKCLHINGNN